MSNQGNGHYFVPPYSRATRYLNFSLGTEESSLFDGSKMLPIQRNSNFSSLRDDERDDAGSATQPRIRSGWGSQQTDKHYHRPNISVLNASVDRSVEFRQRYVSVPQAYPPQWQQTPRWHSRGSVDAYHYQNRQQHRPIGMIPITRDRPSGPMVSERYRPAYPSSEPERHRASYSTGTRVVLPASDSPRNRVSVSVTNAIPTPPKAVISKGLVLPRGLISKPPAEEQIASNIRKRRAEENQLNVPTKKTKVSEPLAGKFDKLDLLCSATLDLGPLQENPTGCSCPKSKCIALYCDCFKAGRRCSQSCTCLDCKNTVKESGPTGARSKAIHSILARNPRAFTNAGKANPQKLNPGEQGCNCVRSRCLKLYCTCFQIGKTCDPSICTCVQCLNIEKDPTGARKYAIEMTLEKRPDAFRPKKKKREVGAGCACKNNKCIRKYCECFRTKRKCSKICSCKDCQNQDDAL